MIKKKTKCLSKKEKLFKKLGLRRSCTGLNQNTTKTERKKKSPQTTNFVDSLEEFLPGYNWVENKITGKHSMPRKSTPDSTQHQQCSSTELFDDKKLENLHSIEKKSTLLTMKESSIEEKELNNLKNGQETAINLSGTERIESEVHSTEDGNQLRMNVLGKRKSPFSQNIGEADYQKFERMHSPQTTRDNYGRRIGNTEDQSASMDMNNDVICLSDRDKGGAADLNQFDKTRGSSEFQLFNSKYMSLRQKEEELVLEITERKDLVNKKKMELNAAEEKLKESWAELNKIEASRRQMELKHEERMAKLKSSAAEDFLKKNNMVHAPSSSPLNNFRSSPVPRACTPSHPLPHNLAPSIPTTAQQQLAEAMTGLANIQQKLPNQEIVTKERQVQEAVKVAEGRRMQNFGVPVMQPMMPNRFMQPNMNPMAVMGQQQWRPTPVTAQQIPRKMMKNCPQMATFHMPNQVPVSIPQASIPPNFRPGQTTMNQIAAVSPQPNQPSLPPSPHMKSPKSRSVKEGEEEKKKPSCDRCFKEANYLCSNCKKIWYCSSTCQYSSWEAHSRSCLKAV